jgi:hypothetical protein
MVLEGPNIINFQCSRPPTDVCVLSQAKPKEYVFSAFDPVKGRLRDVLKLAETPSGWNWSLSPDGTVIAAAEVNAVKHQVRLESLTGQPPREITVKDWNNFMSIEWAADGKGFFVSSNPTGRLSTLLYVDLAGNGTPTLASEELPGDLGDSVAQREVRGYSGAYNGVQCLDGGKFVSLAPPLQ